MCVYKTDSTRAEKKKGTQARTTETCRKQSSGILILRAGPSSTSRSTFLSVPSKACNQHELAATTRQTRRANAVQQKDAGEWCVCVSGKPTRAVDLARVEPAGYSRGYPYIRMAQYVGGTSYSYDKKKTRKKCFQQTTTERKNIKRKKETQRHKSSAKPSAETTVPEPTTETCKLGKGKGRHEPTFLPHPARERASRPTPAPPAPRQGSTHHSGSRPELDESAVRKSSAIRQ